MDKRNLPKPTQVYTFPELHSACANRDMRARLYLFDGGQTVEITDKEGKQLIRDTEEWGDANSVIDRTAMTLMQRGLLTIFDFHPTQEQHTNKD